MPTLCVDKTLKMENKQNMQFTVFAGKNAENYPSLEESEARSGYIKAGTENDYFERIYNLSTKSPLLQSITTTLKNYVCSFTTDSDDEEIDEVIEKAALDYILFNGFCLFVVRRFGKMKVSWIDFKNIRTNKDCTKFFYSKQWGKLRSEWLEYPRFNKNSDEEKSIFYYNGNSRRGNTVYPIPTYSGALLDIQTDANISLFWSSSVENNFCASAILSFNNGVPTKDIQDEIEKKVNEKFSGASNAGRMLLCFNDSTDNAVTVERIAEDNFDQKYQALTSTLEKRIFAAFRVNPMLCGINIQTGFQKQEFMDAYNLCYITVIAPIQKVLKRQFDKVGINIEFSKMAIYEDGTTEVEDTTDIVEGEA